MAIKLAEDVTVSQYLGQNAFGASAKIKKIDTDGFGIALTNGINVDATSNLALLSLAIPMPPQEAKAIKADISYFVDVDLPENNSLTNVLTSSSHSKATINDPTEVVSNYRYIPARLIKVGAFRRSTGEVIGWRAFN